jgi:hypothetical protein
LTHLEFLFYPLFEQEMLAIFDSFLFNLILHLIKCVYRFLHYFLYQEFA